MLFPSVIFLRRISHCIFRNILRRSRKHPAHTLLLYLRRVSWYGLLLAAVLISGAAISLLRSFSNTEILKGNLCCWSLPTSCGNVSAARVSQLIATKNPQTRQPPAACGSQITYYFRTAPCTCGMLPCARRRSRASGAAHCGSALWHRDSGYGKSSLTVD